MPPEPHVEVDFKHRLGSLDLAINFSAHATWTILFGPSGSGKSTILRVIAGLERPHSGRVTLQKTMVFDSRRWLSIAASKRPVHWAPQRAMLIPNKTVRANLVMGLSAQATPADDLVSRLIEHFHLGSLQGLPADHLSGGERQRVSIVRAAAGAHGKLLLLDEPFAGLDAAIRDQLISDLKSWLGPTPVISVTHDVHEAFLLGAEIIRIASGHVVSQGSATGVLAAERARILTNLA